MSKLIYNHLSNEVRRLGQEGLLKGERMIATPQGTRISVETATGTRSLLNLCANNYLGYSNHPQLRDAAHAGLDEFGFGTSSVRFICGTFGVHRELEARLSQFLGFEDTILFSSCFDANAGLFEAVFDERDAIISDALNHASIIDGVRLSKAKRLRYPNCDMEALEACLATASDARFRIIVTDGVFSMDGIVARLPEICELADKYDALTMVDDSHAMGVLGAHGRGTPEHLGVEGRVDLVTGTLGKALGGASGGYVSGRRELIEWLRQRARPYLFSNALPPLIASASIAAVDMAAAAKDLRAHLLDNSRRFRTGLESLGFRLAGAGHPIIPVLIGSSRASQEFSRALFEQGVLVTSFSYPVVPEGQARVRTQMSAMLSDADLDEALEAFHHAGRALAVIG